MKILFDHANPFFLSHGGFQVQIEQTKKALESLGAEVDWARWWDEQQQGDIIHFFGRPPVSYIEQAHQKRVKVVIGELLGGVGARGPATRTAQRMTMLLVKRFVPGSLIVRLAWESYQKADACIALTSWEAHLMKWMFEAPADRVHVIPNGVEDIFTVSSPTARGPWLVTAGTITEVKRAVEIAEAAVVAKTPIWFIGRAYDESLPYPQRFFQLARSNPKIIRYEGAINDRGALAAAYRQARGFVLLSRWETLSVAALEAAAGQCPLLLSDMPWARSAFGDGARYCPVGPTETTARVLREFYDAAPTLPPPPAPLSWKGVADRLLKIYQSVLSERSA